MKYVLYIMSVAVASYWKMDIAVNKRFASGVIMKHRVRRHVGKSLELDRSMPFSSDPSSVTLDNLL